MIELDLKNLTLVNHKSLTINNQVNLTRLIHPHKRELINHLCKQIIYLTSTL